MGKSRRSWRIRFKTSALRTLPVWAVWNLLPVTLLLRFGALFPNSANWHTPEALCDAIEEVASRNP